jgi:hypothetical protein
LGGDPTAIAEATATAAELASPAPPPPPVASTANVIYNGDFEEDWSDWQPVASGWESFDNDDAHYGWYKDTWPKVVYDGEQAQMIEIASAGREHRYAGIYQTVKVVPGAEYVLTIHGLVRSDEGSEGVSGGGYVMQYGLDYEGDTDWEDVTEWVDLPFPEHPREDPNATNVYNYGTYTVNIKPTGNKLTLYIRGCKKWPDPNEVNFDIDALSLRGTGAQPAPTPEPTTVEETPTPLPAPTDTPTPAPLPTDTPTPIPEIPASGGVVETGSPSSALIVISIVSILVLAGGAVWGIIKRRA